MKMTLPPPPTDSLFRWIETQEAAVTDTGRAPWGRVLDAGTGRHSLRWLTRLAPAISQIVAVTGEKPLADELTKEFGTREGPQLQVHAGNWLDASFLADEAQFDVIVADYLVGSIEGFAPFFQDEIFDRLKPMLAPHGRMYVVGLEPLTETKSSSASDHTAGQAQCTARCCAPPTDEDAALVQDMARVRDACILLAGRRCYREFPLTWTQRQLEKSGLQVTNSVQMTNVYTVETIGRQLKVARNQLKWFQDDALASAMDATLTTFETRVRETLQGGKRKIRFGFDYVVAASNSG